MPLGKRSFRGAVLAPLVAGVVTVALTGCGGDDVAESIAERAMEAGGVEGADIDLSDGGFSVETDEGSISSGSQAEMPAAWPEDVPIVDGGEVYAAAELDTGVQVSMLYRDGDADAVSADAREALEDAGWTEQSLAESEYEGQRTFTATYAKEGDGRVLALLLSHQHEGEGPLLRWVVEGMT